MEADGHFFPPHCSLETERWMDSQQGSVFWNPSPRKKGREEGPLNDSASLIYSFHCFFIQNPPLPFFSFFPIPPCAVAYFITSPPLLCFHTRSFSTILSLEHIDLRKPCRWLLDSTSLELSFSPSPLCLRRQLPYSPSPASDGVNKQQPPLKRLERLVSFQSLDRRGRCESSSY